MLFRSGSRIGAICAIAGSTLLFVGTFMHPMGADPNDTIAAFTEYAADPRWITTHLMQLAGVVLIVAALLFLAYELEAGQCAAFAVRQIEIGLASMLSLSLGLTATAFGVTLLADTTYPKWFAGLAVVGGVSTVLAGVVMAYTGFSALEMAINMPANLLLLVWVVILAVLMWRRGEPVDEKSAVQQPFAADGAERGH